MCKQNKKKCVKSVNRLQDLEQDILENFGGKLICLIRVGKLQWKFCVQFGGWLNFTFFVLILVYTLASYFDLL